MSLQFSILKILAGRPNARATVPDLNRYITLLNVPEWTARMKRLSTLAPNLDIFGSQYVLRDDAGWQLTEAGRSFVEGIELAVQATPEQITLPEIVVTLSAPRVSPPLRLVADNSRERRARLNDRSSNRSAVA